MKISIEHSDGSAFSIKVPNWLALGRLGIGFLARSIVKQNGGAIISVKIGVYNTEKEPEPLAKKEYKEAVKEMKRILIGARGELRAFLKRHPDFVLVDVIGEGGDHVRITL